MERLSGIDAAFLYLETASAHMHVTGTIVLDPRDAPDGYSFGRLSSYLLQRLAELPRFRRRIVEFPLGLDHPMLVEDADFDPSSHLRGITAARPGSGRELAETVAKIAGDPLDRSRPLWELWIIEGLEDDRVAFVLKAHHALLDGVSGTRVLQHLFSLTPDTSDDDRTEAWAVLDRVPSTAALVAEGLRSQFERPRRFMRALVRTGEGVATLIGESVLAGPSDPSEQGEQDPVENSAPLPFVSAPRIRFNRSLTPERTVAFGRASLADLKRVRAVFETKVNAVALAAATWALRGYLAERGDLPEIPLIATVPISEHGGDQESEEIQNRVSAMFVRLPVQLDDPIDQLLAIHRDSVRAKRVHESLGDRLLADWVDLAPPALFSAAARLYSSMHLADRVPPVHNVVISNVPGPPVPLYAAGARVTACYPFGPVLEGAGVNISMMSYLGSVDFGVIACPHAMPDPWALAEGFEEAVAVLVERAEQAAQAAPQAAPQAATSA